MDKNKKYTANEVSHMLSISRQTVYNRMSKDLQEFVSEENGVKLINQDGVDYLKKLFVKNRKKDESNCAEEIENIRQEMDKILQEVDSLKMTVKELTERINRQQEETSGRLLDILENQQKLQALQIQKEQEQQKKSWLSRLLNG